MLAISLALLAGAGFGGSAIFARVGMQKLSPMPTILISVVVSAIPAMLLAVIFARGDIRAAPAAAFLWLVVLGAVNFLGGRTQNYQAINRIGASQASTILATSAVFATIFAMGIAGERPHFLIPLGTVGVVIGLAVSTGDSIRQGWATDRRALLGYVLAFGAAASYGGTNVLAKELTEDYGSPLMISGFSLLFGVFLLAPVAGRSTVDSLRRLGNERGTWAFAALSGFSSAVAVIALYYALQREDVVVVSPITAAYPLMVLLIARMFMSQLERITKQVVAGSFLTIFGIIVVIIGSTL
ncbi:MAG: hypothetical protein BZY81_05730 [SAR202 cluster bacterium Io17-Chloro-G4]|nr:MAG: hypothetical protein BZY81_05730 [SAR202 cluster bacterium Io17-Chloro-G4]